MKKRKLQTGEEIIELDEPVMLKVYTKCPEKWLLTDLETGEQYIGHLSKGSLDWCRLDSTN